MKTYQIELQRVKAASNGNGMIHLQLDALVQPRAMADDRAPVSVLSVTEENARVLLTLLKAQLAEFDKRKARSQR